MSQPSGPMLIAPFKTGLDTDIQPWIAPADSFSTLNNIHVEHGYLEKRNGFQYFAKKPSTLTNGTAVTGFATYIQTTTGVKTLLAFDTRSAYTYNGGTKLFTQLVDSIGASPTIFGGGQDDFVWSANWQSTAISNVNRLYFTNGRPLAAGVDGIWYFNGTTPATVTSFSPSVGGGVALTGAKLIFSMGQRLVTLFTYEGGANTEYPQRARWCAKQNPANWNDTVAGGGDFTDAATSDQIISAQLLQNQLIVFFTDSVWTLLPTSDPNRAFRWQKINNFRACGGKNASVGFDRYIAALGSRGITGTDGNNTTRIDERISDFTMSEISQKNIDQTFCLRDFNNRRWWTLYNDDKTSTATKTKTLVFDDDSGAYSTYSIPMNVLGRGTQGFDYSYDEFTVANGFLDPDGDDKRYIDFNKDETYDSYLFQEDAEQLIAGNYSGTVFTLEKSSYDFDTSITSEFTTASWNPFKEEGSGCIMNYVDILVDTSTTTKATIYFYKDTENTPYSSQVIDFLPDLNFISTINAASQANPCNVSSADHGLTTGDNVYIYHVEGMTDINSGGIFEMYTVTVVDENNFTLDNVNTTASGAYTGSGEIYERPFYRTKTWKRAFAGGIGFQHRIGFESSGLTSSFRIHAFKPFFKQRGRRITN